MCVSVDGFGTHNGEVSISERGLVKIKHKRVKRSWRDIIAKQLGITIDTK